MSIGTYAALINGKVIVPSSRNDYWAVNKHFLADLLSGALASVRIDEDWYLRRYPDVAKAIAAGEVASGGDHYRRYGFFEHRMPVPIAVREDWYFKQYPDVRTAVDAKVFASAQAHFETIGYSEGRLPFAGFSLNGVEPGSPDQERAAAPERPGRPLFRSRPREATSGPDAASAPSAPAVVLREIR